MKILDRYDAAGLRRMFDEEGILFALAERGFRDFDITVAESGLPGVRLFGHKNDQNWLLLEASITEYTVPPDCFRRLGHDIDRPVRLALAYWLREEDPTVSFAAGRPPLPLQRHPGLGVLRNAFHVLTRMARERGLDGVACVPKFFHDAVIFFRSRLFLFLSAEEEGRFEALLRDLGSLPLGIASTRIGCGDVRNDKGEPELWSPGLQVCPLTPVLTAYFNSPAYAARVRTASESTRVVCAETPAAA